MELTCKNCNISIQNPQIKLNHYINEIPQGIELVLMYHEDLKYPINLNELANHLIFIKN